MKQFFDEGDGRWRGIEPSDVRAERRRELGYEVLDLDLDKSSLPFPDDRFKRGPFDGCE